MLGAMFRRERIDTHAADGVLFLHEGRGRLVAMVVAVLVVMIVGMLDALSHADRSTPRSQIQP